MGIDQAGTRDRPVCIDDDIPIFSPSEGLDQTIDAAHRIDW
jgi:hypothetical protein